MPQTKVKSAKRKTTSKTSGKTASDALGPKQLAALNAQKVGDLTPEQIASIHSNASLLKIPVKARAALSAEQVRAVDVRRLSVGHLTDEQIGWLSQDQIQNLAPAHLRYVQASQVNWVTVEQMAGIRDDALRHMSTDVRSAFGEHHVQAMDFTRVSLKHLLPEQCAWMSFEQIQSLGYRQFRYLSPDQVAQLSVEQVTSIPTRNIFQRLPKSVREAFTEEHWQAMPADFDDRGVDGGPVASVVVEEPEADVEEQPALEAEPFVDETPYPEDLTAFKDDEQLQQDDEQPQHDDEQLQQDEEPAQEAESFEDETPYPEDLASFTDDAQLQQDDEPAQDDEQGESPEPDAASFVDQARDQEPVQADDDAEEDAEDEPSAGGESAPMTLGTDPIQLESLKPEPVAQLGDEPVWSLEDELNADDAMKLFEEVSERKAPKGRQGSSATQRRRSQGSTASRSDAANRSFFDHLLEWLRSMITPAR